MRAASAVDTADWMRRPVVPLFGRGARHRVLLALGATLVLVGHLLGPHSGAHTSSLVLAGDHPPERGWHHADVGAGPSHQPEHPESPEHEESAGDPPCGYLCLRGDDHGTAGAGTGRRAAPATLPAPPTSRVRRGGHSPRAPPDPVRELQVIRV